jgi:hypothetical protein
VLVGQGWEDAYISAISTYNNLSNPLYLMAIYGYVTPGYGPFAALSANTP